MTLLALDYGDRYVGLAITDPDDKITLRYGSIDQKEKPAITEIMKIIEQENIKKVIVGMPIGLSGQDSEQTTKTKQFTEALKTEVGKEIDICTNTETYTSKEAKRTLSQEGKKDITEEHSEAARLILENYIQSHKTQLP